MSELPTIRLSVGDREYEATPENASLYRYLGNLACYDHVFIQTGENEDSSRTGNIIFLRQTLRDEVIQQLTHFMLTRGFAAHVNQHEVLPCDVEAFNRMVSAQVEDFDTIPEEWASDGTTE